MTKLPQFSSAPSNAFLWPSTDGFAGRDTPMAIGQRCLQQDGVLVITGAPGIGKTWLAARLGEEFPKNRRIWIDCNPKTGLVEIAWVIARKLQDEALWNFLQHDRLASFPDVARIDWLVDALSRDHHLLCFDNLHHIYEIPAVIALVKELAALAPRIGSKTRLILVTRRPPPFLPRFGYLALKRAGFDLTPRLFAQHNVKPSETVSHKVHDKLGGTPRLVDLMARGIKEQVIDPLEVDSSKSVLLYDEKLADMPSTNRYVLGELVQNAFQELTETERLVLHAIALSDHPVQPEWIKIALDGETTDNVRFALYRLQSLGLVTSDEPSGEINVIPVLRQLYRDWADGSMVQRLHANLARHFEWEGDILAATRHYISAGETHKAAKFLIRFVDYVDRDKKGQVATLINDRLLSLPPTRALPNKVQNSLRQILTSLGHKDSD